VKPVRLSKHAQGYLASRGFTLAEVEEAIRTSPWQPAELGKQEYPSRSCARWCRRSRRRHSREARHEVREMKAKELVTADCIEPS
jgi:hypothetical protein